MLRSPIGSKPHGRPSCGDISMTIAGEAIRAWRSLMRHHAVMPAKAGIQ
jgi:hypothetical protein